MKIEKVLKQIDAAVFVECTVDPESLFCEYSTRDHKQVAPSANKAEELANEMNRLRLQMKRMNKMLFFSCGSEKGTYHPRFLPEVGDIMIFDNEPGYEKTARTISTSVKKNGKIFIAGCYFSACVMVVIEQLIFRGYTVFVFERYTDFFYQRNIAKYRQDKLLVNEDGKLKLGGQGEKKVDMKIDKNKELINSQNFLLWQITKGEAIPIEIQE